MEIFLIILAVIFALFLITFAIYWFNLDMKLVRKVYDLLGKHYFVDVEKDKAVIQESYYSILKEESLAIKRPDLAAEWHPHRNGNLTPEMFSKSSSEKVWWKCASGHEWQAVISSRYKGNNCPFCSGKKLLVGYNDLATKNPELAKEWHPTKNGDLKPTDVVYGSGKKVWWYLSYDDSETGKHFGIRFFQDILG